jgi:hypothetical protein
MNSRDEAFINLALRNSITSEPSLELFVYDPRKYCPYSPVGAEAKDCLCKLGPSFSYIFQQKFSLTQQTELINGHYRAWQVEVPNLKVSSKLSKYWEKNKNRTTLDDDIQKYIKKSVNQEGFKGGYFASVRNFTSIVPEEYVMTEAPRISAKGSTLHGLRKDFKLSVLTDLARKTNLTFVEVDMSACHTRVAASLIGPSSSLHNLFKEGSNF